MRYFCHPESDSYFEMENENNIEEMLKTADGALCIEITKVEFEKETGIHWDDFTPGALPAGDPT